MKRLSSLRLIAALALTIICYCGASAQITSPPDISFPETIDMEYVSVEDVQLDTTVLSTVTFPPTKIKPISIYELPYSLRGRSPDWHRLWLNTAVYAGAFVSTLFVLECLPEGATNWNKATIQSVPFYKRWWKNVIKRGPEIDGDNPVFNYVLHPYAGAVYFMSARTSGFNFYQSLLYSACISTIGWEFGIEGTMERPSIQDIFITPLVGSVIGELFYRLKRNIVYNDYHLFGSPVLGYVVAFLIDPVNELFGYFGNSNTRNLHLKDHGASVTSSFMPTVGHGSVGFSLVCTF